MNKDKQIDEMANALYENRPYKDLWLEDAQDIAKVLHNEGYRKQSEWISVEDRLPNEGEYVLIFTGSIHVAEIKKGISEEERKRMRNGEISDPKLLMWTLSEGNHYVPRSCLYSEGDVDGNNTVPYCWRARSGSMRWLGQDVTHWMPLPEAPKMKGGDGK